MLKKIYCIFVKAFILTYQAPLYHYVILNIICIHVLQRVQNVSYKDVIIEK